MDMNEFMRRIVNSHSSYKFLGAEKGKWIDSNDKKINISDMNYDYISNSMKYLEKSMHGFKYGTFLAGMDYDSSEWDEMVQLAIKAAVDKLEELKQALPEDYE